MSPNQTTETRANPPTRANPTISNKSHRPRPGSTNLRREEERLSTFQNWPLTFITPEVLAVDGFYYFGQEDIVRCAFCGVEVGQWVQGDNVRRDHERWAPDCEFVRGLTCGNVPLGESSEEVSPSGSPPSYDVCGPFMNMIRPYSGPERAACPGTPGTLVEDLEQLGVSRTSCPVKPKYATEESRLRTFVGWPSSCPLTPNQLAAAGFFYTGVDDHAICFLCGGGLKDWEEGDDPWVEHARWFSRCAFILMQKGRDFVVRVTNEKPPILPCEAVKELLEQQPELPADNVTTEITTDEEEESKDVVSSSCATDPNDSDSEGGAVPDMELCQICFTRKRRIVLLPCGHFVCCAMCAFALTVCPICRKPLKATVRAHWS